MRRKEKKSPNIYNHETIMSSSYELAEQGKQSTSVDAEVDPLLKGSENEMKAEVLQPTPEPPVDAKLQALQLLFGAGGIYAAFLYYGSLQEDVFRYESEDGLKFTMAWYLQVLESFTNVVVGVAALIIMGLTGTGYTASDDSDDDTSDNKKMKWWGGTPNLPKKPFISTGFTQVCSKAFTSLALANGLSFPVATLAKSGKMAPVMIGSLMLGGAKYGCRDYLQVLAIISGTAILSMSKKKAAAADSSTLGVMFILLALVMDGLTGGVQKRLLADMKQAKVTPQPYDLMTFTNLFMLIFALIISVVLGEFKEGMLYCAMNPQVYSMICKFSLCSAIGQSFIFYTLARFDPLVCSTVTTTRKIFSVMLSIVFKGHSIPMKGYAGLALAFTGIVSEVVNKVTKGHKNHKK